ncbi:conserved hypothetical protein [Candidatus Zixiibacteriota bacterium]|nr:conserved hypothetical protein [candidate division Zixibacteria bacterium]
MRYLALKISFLICFLYTIAGAVDSTGIIQREYFIFHFDNPIFVSTADSALNAARGQLIGLLNDSLDYRPDIYISDNLEEFKKVVGSAFPDWGAAAALPYRRLIAIKSPAHFRLGKPLRELLIHEYAHLALAHRLGLVQAPRWLDEGLAMRLSAEWGWEQNLSMSRAAIFNAFVPLRQIDRMNLFTEGEAQIAYSESYLAVKYLLDSYGRETFNLFLNKLKEGKDTDEALFAATGSHYDDFEKEFFDYLHNRYNLMTFFGDTIYFWSILGLIVIVAAVLSFFRRKKKYKEWEEEEKYQSRDFDYGNPDDPEEIDDDDKPWS